MDANGRRWAFSLSNAGAYFTQFRSRLDQLDEVDWPSVKTTDFRSRAVREGKQAEFLVHEYFPWELVERLGVLSATVAGMAKVAMAAGTHRPRIEIRPEWYYERPGSEK
jgi:hypothetical protein